MSSTGTENTDYAVTLAGDKQLSKRVDELKSWYPDERAALIPALHEVQKRIGWLPDGAVTWVAEQFSTTPADVLAVITFYDMFHREPRGKHEVAVCRNLACRVTGGDEVVRCLEKKLGVRVGETTEDGEISLSTFECLGGCTEAPIVATDWYYHGNVDPAKAEAIVDGLKAGTPAAQEPRVEEPEPHKSKPEIYLTKRMREHGEGPGLEVSLAAYEKSGGYKALEKALSMDRDAVIDVVKESGLRGRGGAGFPTGVKWGFMPKEPKKTGKPHYLAVNADESEPGTCKDRLLMERDPHSLIEGCVISAYAIRAEKIYIYIRGEYLHSADVMQKAIEAARAKGFLGKDVMGKKGVNIDAFITRGAGAYICGEETAMMESLEGKRGHPRPKPPFPAASGLWKSPTTVNNVESLCNVAYIMANGAKWYRAMGNEKSPGNLLYQVSGQVKRPGIYEMPLGTTARTLINECAGGMLEGYELVGYNPGGASAGFFPPDMLDVALDHDTMKEHKSMLGTGAITVVDQKFGMLPAIDTFISFFEHETCGQCGPCREGCAWAHKLMRRFLNGRAKIEDLDVMLDLLDNAMGKTICVYPEAIAGPIKLGIEHFRDEFERATRPEHAASSAK